MRMALLSSSAINRVLEPSETEETFALLDVDDPGCREVLDVLLFRPELEPEPKPEYPKLPPGCPLCPAETEDSPGATPVLESPPLDVAGLMPKMPFNT